MLSLGNIAKNISQLGKNGKQFVSNVLSLPPFLGKPPRYGLS